jgi:streptogramin lyase
LRRRPNHRNSRFLPSQVTEIDGFSGDGASATKAAFADPQGVAIDPAGNLFIADYGNNRIRKIAPNGVITTFAGTGTAGFGGDSGPATSA